jgi:alpha-L-glutamate ligase-like protein
MKASDILGLNARTNLYSYKFNKKSGKAKAASKLATKKALIKADIPVPTLFARFKNPAKINDFDWSKLPSAFALKPSKGMGGEGIIVIKKRLSADSWLTTNRKVVTVDDLKLHVLDVIEGAYSIGNVPDVAFIEEYVGRHKAFKKFSFRGTPDIRVIVFNSIPVMAMLRLPTKESGGRANLHQGAIGVGIDIATGVTTHAYWHGEYIKFKPETNKKLNGIKIPFWDKVLTTAVMCSRVTKLGYVGADIILHPEKGPMILELNYQPGLSIQLANHAGLRRRLVRVEDLEVNSAEHGVRIGKALFATFFSDRVKGDKGSKTISALEEIKIRGFDKRKHKVLAKIDTGAWRTSINRSLAEKLGLMTPDNILWTKSFRSSLGREERPVVAMTFWLAGRRIVTPASVAKRTALRYPVIIGRKNLKGFLVDPHITDIDTVKKQADKSKKNN